MNEPALLITAGERTQKRELAVAPSPVDPNATPMQMLAIMTQRGVSISDMKELVALAKDFEANQARKAFNEAFAAFKSEAVKIIKGTEVKDGPLKGKFHANLFDVVNGTTPFLSKHALAISWRLSKDEPTWMEVTCTLRHALGHSESVSMGAAPDTGPGRNAIQARGSTKTYLERYTATAILGLAAQDADTDGASSYERVTDKQAADLQALIDEVGANKIQFLKYLKVDALKDINADAYRDCVKLLEEKRRK